MISRPFLSDGSATAEALFVVSEIAVLYSLSKEMVMRRTSPRTWHRRLFAAALATALGAGGLAAATPAAAASAPQASATSVAPPPEGWPTFGYQGVITDKSQMSYNPTDEFIFPTLFHAGEHLENPLGEWYLYTAPHDAPAGIILMYSDSLAGPWTEYTEKAPLISNVWEPHYKVSHTSSPDAIWNEEAGKMFLYFHGENSVTRYATSDDGITFEYGGSVVTNAMGGPNVTETSYARVFEHPDENSEYQYGMFYMGNERDNIRRVRLAESVDGVTWTVDPDYVVAPGAEEGANVSGGNLWERDGQLYVVYHGSSGKSYARTIDATLRQVGEVPIVLHQSTGIGVDVGRVAAPEIVTDDSGTYLFYESGDRLGATVAYAKEGAEPEVGPIFEGFPSDPANPLFAECAADGSDEFTAGLAPVWDRVVREESARHAVEDDALVIPTYTGGVAAAPLLQQELPEGAWQVTTELDIAATQRFQQGGILLYASDTHYVKLGMGRATPGPTVELVFHRNGVNRQDSRAPEVAGATRIWLRLTNDGAQVQASVSYDGTIFADFGRPVESRDMAFTHIGPFAFRGTTEAAEIPARFDWFRFSPSTEQYEECQNAEPPLPADNETAAPGAGVLSSTSGWATGLDDGTFELRWNMWWGANAVRVKVYENGALIHTGDLTAAGPAAQSVTVPISGRVNGEYVYTAEVINSQGVSQPQPLTVTVKDALPGIPKLALAKTPAPGEVRIVANMWWGTNASAWRLLEDGAVVAEGELAVMTPQAQRVEAVLEGRAPGARVYVMEFVNAAGVTASSPISVTAT